MNMTKANVVLLTSALTLGTAAVGFAGDKPGSNYSPATDSQRKAVQPNRMGQQIDRPSWHFADAETTQSLVLTTQDGTQVGQITDLIVDKSTGQIQLYLAELNDQVPDRDGQKVAIEAQRVIIRAKAQASDMSADRKKHTDAASHPQGQDQDLQQQARMESEARPHPDTNKQDKDNGHDMMDLSADKADQPTRCAVTTRSAAELAVLAEFDPEDHPMLYATSWYRELGKDLGIVEKQNPAMYQQYFLSDIVGRQMVAADGTEIGEADDVIVELDSGTLAMVLIVPDVDGVEGERVLPWGLVDNLANGEIRVQLGASKLANAMRAPRDGNFTAWDNTQDIEPAYKPFGLDVPDFDAKARGIQSRSRIFGSAEGS